MISFKQKVLSVVKKIPKGKVLTYKQVAQKTGSPKAYRAVGNILSNNFDKNIPCHRVIKSDGSVGNYNGLLGKDKQKILEIETGKYKNQRESKDFTGFLNFG